LEHPDLHWFFPLPRPKGASSPDRLQAALESARHEELSEWRSRPVRYTPTTGPTGIYLAAVRTLRALASKRPATGPRHVFVVGRAEALVPQEASPEAANALLKILEEPPQGTTIILTSSEPERLLPTIRSRTVSVHVPPMATATVTAFLEAHTDATPEAIERATWLSRGSIGRALGYLPDDEEHGPLEQARRDAFAMLRSALGNPAGAYREAGSRSPAGARALMPLLDQLGIWLRDLAAISVGAEDQVVNRDALEAARGLVAPAPSGRPRIHPTALTHCLERVEHARVLAQGNVNPQLVVFGLLHEIHKTLHPSPTGP